jgi:hypothetical protein
VVAGGFWLSGPRRKAKSVLSLLVFCEMNMSCRWGVHAFKKRQGRGCPFPGLFPIKLTAGV